MVKIESFTLESYLNDNGPKAKHNITSSCSLPISLEGLKSLSDNVSSEEDGALPADLRSRAMDYGAPFGSEKLRARLASLYSVKASTSLSAENVLITPGASLANFLIFYGLCDRGDHVICHYPTYQQLYTQPAALGLKLVCGGRRVRIIGAWILKG
ncbi:hypothetical protein ACJ72_06050 [Emergomyces africanus]|uniref:Aminotransferase class I/classII large domain-containing protein n=1 Tax=Emergomyces africanus TaxID=1955775 RepID=A0A1B7NSB3_9EURO|nr:hypothetical protein ACJ72_06050 [Emergomyces africanus]